MANFGYKEAQSIIRMIRNTKGKEIIIISLFLFPVLLEVWFVPLGGILYGHDDWKFGIVCILLVLYVIGIIIKFSDTQGDKLRRAKSLVEIKLKKRGGRASFDAIRNEVNKTYSNEFLEKLIDVNPEIFGKCLVISGGVNKEGITLIGDALKRDISTNKE